MLQFVISSKTICTGHKSFKVLFTLNFQVNIAGNTRRQIEQMMETKPNEQMFDSAQNQVGHFTSIGIKAKKNYYKTKKSIWSN